MHALVGAHIIELLLHAGFYFAPVFVDFLDFSAVAIPTTVLERSYL